MKKNSILFFTMLLFTVSLNAQVALQQGTKSIGGSISYLSGNLKNDYYEQTQTSFLISPQFTTFIKDNLELGIQLIYQFDKYETKQQSYSYYGQSYSSTYTAESKSLGPGLLFNLFFPTSETLAPFIGAGASVLFNPDHFESKIMTFFGQGGLNLFIREYASVNIKAQYSVQKASEPDLSGSSLFIGVGMNFYLLAD